MLLASYVTLNKTLKLSEPQFLQMLRYGMTVTYPNYLKGLCEAQKKECKKMKAPKITGLKTLNAVPMSGIIA